MDWLAELSIRCVRDDTGQIENLLGRVIHLHYPPLLALEQCNPQDSLFRGSSCHINYCKQN